MKRTVLVVLLVCVLSVSCAAQAEGMTSYPITLNENQTTGYMWEYTCSDEAVIAVDDAGYASPETTDSMVGVGGTHTWTLTGLQQGTATVIFTYTPSWGSGPDDPVVQFHFTVDAQHRLTLQSTEGMPEQYMAKKTIVRLQENQTTGYAWTVSIEPQGLLILDRDEAVPGKAAEGMVGVGGEHVWIFSSVAKGTVQLTFTYARAGGADASAIKLTYIVNEQLQVTLMGIDGDYSMYISE